MKVHAGKFKRKDYGKVSAEVGDMLHQLDMARKLLKDKRKKKWQLAKATAGNPFILIGKPQR